MSKLVILRFILLLIGLGIIVSGKPQMSYAQKINKRLPSVFISFKEFIAKTPDPAYPSQGVRLLIHNNTKWPIVYWTHYDPTVARGAIIYIIENRDGSREERAYVDVVMRGKLTPGNTLSLIIPRDNFPKGSSIYVEFNFLWELNNDDRVRDEAVHRAYFLASNLPTWPDAKVNQSK